MASDLIQNGDFSDDFDHWSNGCDGFYAFNIDDENAYCESYAGSLGKKWFKMKQSFQVSQEILTAGVTVWAKWHAEAPGYGTDGEVSYIIDLKKPDASVENLLDITKTAEDGNGNILDDEDVSSHLATQGTYYLEIRVGVKSGDPNVLGEYQKSWSWIDDVSIANTVKLKKAVIESLGFTPAENRTQSRSKSEIHQLVESYSTLKGRLVSEMEVIQLVESYIKVVKATRLETLAYSESLFQSGFMKNISEIHNLVESYLTQKTRFGSDADIHQITETLSAIKTSGNTQTYYTIGPDTTWIPVTIGDANWDKIRMY